MDCPRDLREFVQQMEARGLLYRYSNPINKETELYPFFRVQQRGLPDEDRKVILFDNVHGAKGNHYDWPVLAGAYTASERIMAAGLGCESYIDALERWHVARAHPIAPVMVDRAPVQENVMVGDDIKKVGLDILPIPVEEPGFSGINRLGLPIITKDPVHGVRNVGTYNCFLKARDRLQSGIGPGTHAMAYHWRTARERKEPLPLAILIGPDLPTMATGSASFPYGIDELAVAGGFMGAPIELVRCKTIPLEVPANAEAIIECEMSTEMGEPRLTFGEYPGYMQSNIIPTPVIKVTAITYRNNAIFTPILVGMPPSDTSLVWGFAHAADHFHYLKYECGYLVAEVYYPQLGGGDTFCLIRMAEGATPDDGQTVADELSRRRSIGKYAVVVDHDIDIRDSDTILWALSFRTNRRRDFAFVPSGHVGLDPSGAPPGARTHRSNDPADNDATRLVINATRKWDYPPVGLPRKEYMDRALQLWAEAKLPQPQMHNPWYGYELGYWTDEHRHHADLIVAGDYKQLGDEMEEFQAPLTEAQIGRNFDRSAAWL